MVRRATRVIPASVTIAYGRGCRDFGGQRHAKGCAVRSLHAQPACSLASARPIRVDQDHGQHTKRPVPGQRFDAEAAVTAEHRCEQCKNATGISTENKSAVGSLTIAKEPSLTSMRKIRVFMLHTSSWWVMATRTSSRLAVATVRSLASGSRSSSVLTTCSLSVVAITVRPSRSSTECTESSALITLAGTFVRTSIRRSGSADAARLASPSATTRRDRP